MNKTPKPIKRINRYIFCTYCLFTLFCLFALWFPLYWTYGNYTYVDLFYNVVVFLTFIIATVQYIKYIKEN